MLKRFEWGVKLCVQSNSCQRSVTTRPPWRPSNTRLAPSVVTGANAIPLGGQPEPGRQKSRQNVEETASDEELTEREKRIKNINAALRIYIEKKRKYDILMAEERAQYELGKRYLANMMGWDSTQDISQDEVDRAIRYLFPASLSDPKAVPIMKPPEDWLPQIRAIEVDKEGRPNDTYFYTMQPRYHRLLSDIAAETQYAIDASRGRTKTKETNWENDPEQEKIPKWISMEEIENIIGEKLLPDMYANIIAALDYRDTIPTPPGETSIMDKFRAIGGGLKFKKAFGFIMPTVSEGLTETGEKYKYTTVKARIKRCCMEVTVKYPGTGKIIVNGFPYDEYRSLLSREVLLSPMLITDLMGTIDVSSKVVPGVNGEISVGGSVIFPRVTRYGAAMGIAALFNDKKDILRLAGLLTSDVRNKERKKIAQKGSRAHWIWQKR